MLAMPESVSNGVIQPTQQNINQKKQILFALRYLQGRTCTHASGNSSLNYGLWSNTRFHPRFGLNLHTIQHDSWQLAAAAEAPHENTV